MRPSTRFVLSLLLLAPALFGWVKQGTVSGNITDIEVIQWNGTSGLIYAATGGSGVFVTFDGNTWAEANGSGVYALPDLQVKALASFPGQDTWLVAACQHGVYFTDDRGDNWYDYNQGLATPFPLMDIAVADYGGQYYLYLASLGDGIFRRLGTPWGGSWVSFNTGAISGNEERLAVSVGANGPRALAGFTKGTGPGNQGHLYWLEYPTSNVWATVTSVSFPQNVPIPAISFRFPDYALVSVGQLGSGSYGGVWSATASSFPNFTQLNPTSGMPTDQPFLALDFFAGGVNFFGAGGTTKGIWSIPKPGSTGSYVRLPFKGAVTGVGVGNPDYCDLFFGGPGKGPFWADLCSPTSKPSVRRQNMNDYQVAGIAVSGGFGVGNDYGVFAASRIAGLYKNQTEPLDACNSKGGYFTRMVGDPAQESAPDILCVGISPIYQEGGAIETGELVLFAGTNGGGVLRTLDGGRSWTAMNTGLTGDAIVTALAVSPRFGVQDWTVYAAVYGRGVYRSDDAGGNWTLTGVAKGLDNPYVNTLALHPNYNSDYPFLYAGCRAAGSQQTFHYFHSGLDSWYSSGGLYFTINSLAAALRGGDVHIYAGTASFGIWSSFDGGSVWQDWNLTTLAGQHIVQVAVSPDYDTNSLVLAAVRPASPAGPGGVYWWSSNGPTEWGEFNQGLADRRVLSVAFDPHFTSSGVVFCGHATQRLYTGYLQADSGPQCEWFQATGFYTTPQRINGVAVDPGDPDLILAATEDMGAFLSFDGGYTFRPWSAWLYYTDLEYHLRVVPRTTAAAIVQPPGLATRNAMIGTDGHGIYYNTYDPALAGSFFSFWSPSSMSPATTGVVNEIRVTPEKILLNESFASGIPPMSWTVTNGGSGGQGLGWSAANPAAVGCTTRAVSAPLSGLVAMIDGDCDGSGATQDDTLTTPSLLSSILDVNTLTLEFDHYFYHFTGYTSQGDVDLWRPSLGAWTNLTTTTATTTTPVHIILDLTAYREPGLRVRFHYTGSYDGWWMVDNVKAIANKAEDIRAAVIDPTGGTAGGDWHSSDFGAGWSRVSDFGGPGLTDMSFTSSLIVPGRGLNGFIWGCSSGKSLARRAACTSNGRAWAYSPLSSSWSACSTTNLDTCEDYRAILQTSAGLLLMGSKGTGNAGSWTGMWSSSDACSTWSASNEGLPSNPMVYALQELSGGNLLIGIVDSSPTPTDEGGVYLSNAASGGRAWVRYSTGFTPDASGTVEIASGGTSVYTGMDEDGIYADSTTITYTGAPTAFFEVAAQACEDTPVSFRDYSAGTPTTWSWTFGDGGSSSVRHPYYTYATAGDYTVALTVSNAYGSDLTPYSRNIEILGELDVSDTLRATRSGGDASITWTDLNLGETGYQVWASNSASSGSPVGIPLGPNVTSTTLSGYTYFRIQPKSTGYLCGDGIVGGSW